MRIIVSCILLICIGLSTFGQTCTPKWTGSKSGGLSPDSIVNLPHATVGVAYSSPIQVKVRRDTVLYQGGSYQHCRVDSILVDTVAGIPIGFKYKCNPKGCSFKGDSVGCVNFFGNAAKGSEGVYHLKVYITIFVYDSTINFPLSIPDSFTFYKLVIDYPAGVSELAASGVFITNPTPNPANNESVLSIYAGHAQHISYKLLDMTGRVVLHEELAEVAGEKNLHIPTTTLPPGAYFIFIQTAEATYKARLIVNH